MNVKISHQRIVKEGAYPSEQKHHKPKTFCVYNAECNFAHQIRLKLHDIHNGFSASGPFWHKVMRSIPHTALDKHVFSYTQPVVHTQAVSNFTPVYACNKARLGVNFQ